MLSTASEAETNSEMTFSCRLLNIFIPGLVYSSTLCEDCKLF